MDVFVECMVKRQKDSKDYLIIAGSIILALVISVALVMFVRHAFMWVVLIAGVWYGVYWVVSLRSIEYEFAFTNGELDVDIIYAQRRRKHMLTVRVKEFVFCAPVFDRAFEAQYLNTTGLTRSYDAVGNPTAGNVYFADFSQNGSKVRLLFEPSEQMIKEMKRYNLKKIHLFGKQESVAEG